MSRLTPASPLPAAAHGRHGAAAIGTFRDLAPLLLALAMRLATGPTANLSYAVIAAYALMGRPHLIRALAMSWLFTMLSPGIAPEASIASIGRYLVLFSAAFSAFLYSNMLTRDPRIRYATLSTLMIGVFLVGHSFLFSPITDVSVLKAISWTLAMATLISAWTGLAPAERQLLERQLFLGLTAILVVSLPLAATSLGYLRNGSGFQGILNHPQAFGPVMALLGGWSAARMLGERQPSWTNVGLAAACVACVLMSEARTAGLAMVGAVAVALAVASALGGMPMRAMAPGLRSPRIWTLAGAAVVAGLLMAPMLSSRIQLYLTKSGRADVTSLSEAYERSRGRLIDEMLENIRERPWTGIGFGIDSNPMEMEISRDPVLGLPTGASIEKGVTPLMVLEEVGIVGAVLIGFWLLRLLRSAARGGLAPLAVCLTVLLLNMGESTLFSPGGLGLIMLILLGWAWSAGTAPARARPDG